MNKKLLFTVAAIPAAFVVPAVAGAEEASTIAIKGNPIVNETLSVSIAGLPSNTFVNSYQWYYVEMDASTNTTTKKPISGATDSSYKLPVEAAGKTVVVEATTTTGTTYTSEPCVIKSLVLTIKEPVFEGYSPTNYVAPGDTVKVVGVEVTDTNGAKLQSSQITYTYQWFYKVGEVFSVINGATGETYTIPTDALEKEMKDIVVKVTAKVGTSAIESNPSKMLTVSKEPTDTLMNDFNDLRISLSKYNLTDFEAFKVKVAELEGKYQALTAAAKANVTNYDVLTQALADIQAVSALNEKVNKIKEVAEKDLPKYLKDIEAAYEKLNLLQRSLDVNGALYNNIKSALKDPSDIAELVEVRYLNKEIIALLNYDNSLIKYGPTSIEELQEKVNAIEARMAKLSKDYQATVQNQTILKEAKEDIKKIEQFIKLFDKLSVNTTPNKQVTMAKSIRTAYEKLTYKQMLLVPDTYVTKLLDAENAEKNQIESLNTEIQKYIGKDQYPINPTVETWQDHVKNINRIITEYKSLTKSSATKIIDYTNITTLQKDFKTAENVIKEITQYNMLATTSGVKISKLQSSYSSTLKAYNKLTSLQQSLVYNAAAFLNNPPGVSIEDDGKVPEDKVNAEALKSKIDSFADISKYTFTQLEIAVNEATVAYKELSSPARKYVTNYHLLTAASNDVKGVTAFHKKVQDAKEETDATKQAKKIKTVETVYAKLPANQQHLAKEQYIALLENRIVDENAPDLSKLMKDIEAMLSNDLYTVTIEEIQKLSDQYDKLSSSDKKLITNATILKTAVADVKKVESFKKQYEKSFEKNPATVISAFAKLTAKQMNLVSEDIRQKIIAAEEGQQTANEAALNLIESINELLQDGEYTADLQTKVTNIRTAYDKLSASEKSLVKNYYKLTQAESDLKKVADVHALYVDPTDTNEVARKAWQTAYGKLSKKLELLYNAMYPMDL